MIFVANVQMLIEMRRSLLFIISFAFVAQSCGGQIEKNITILTLKDDRVELTKALSFLKSSNSKLICLNIDLSQCNQDEVDQELIKAFNETDSLVVSSELLPFGTGMYRDVRLFCSYFYTSREKDGFINLISNAISNEIEKVQLKNTYKTKNFNKEEIGARTRYHMAFNIAFAIDSKKTTNFINSNKDTIKIDFKRKRGFETYSFDNFIEGKIDKKALEGKVVIVTSNTPHYLSIPGDEDTAGEFRKLSTSEIFANIACQILER